MSLYHRKDRTDRRSMAEYVDTLYNSFNLQTLIDLYQMSYDRCIQQFESIG